jgi:hypothetical protein
MSVVEVAGAPAREQTAFLLGGDGTDAVSPAPVFGNDA